MDFQVTNFNTRLRTIRIRELIVGIILAVILTVIIGVIFPVMFDDENIFMSVFLTIGVILFGIALHGTRGFGKDIRDIFTPKIGRELLYVLVINMFFALLFTCIILNVDFILSLYDPSWNSIWVDVTAPTELLIFDIISSVIFAPILEELIFRGVLFNRLKIRIGIIPAMILSSALFGIGHSFGGMTSAFLFGMCMCILYLKTDNIFVGMTVHFLNNLIFVILELLGITFYLQMPYLIPTTILAVISTVLLLVYIIKESSKLKKENSS